MEHRDTFEKAFARYTRRILEPGQWRIEEIGGHLWLFLPRKLSRTSHQVSGRTASMLVGAERLAREPIGRLDAYVEAVGRHVARVANSAVELRLAADPQRVLDNDALQLQDDFYAMLNARIGVATGPVTRRAAAVLGDLLTCADDPPSGGDIDWNGYDLTFPSGFCELLELRGPCNIDGLELFGPDRAFESAARLRDSDHLSVEPVWPGTLAFLPAARLGDWYLGWRVDEKREPERWTVLAVHEWRNEAHSLAGKFTEAVLRRISGVRTEPNLPLIRPRVMPAGWPDPDWPRDWSDPATFEWYARAFRGVEAEITSAARFVADHAPREFLVALLDGLDLDSPSPTLPRLFRRGNGYLELGDHQESYVRATKTLVTGGLERLDDMDAPSGALEILDRLRVSQQIVPDPREAPPTAAAGGGMGDGPISASAVELPDRQTDHGRPARLIGASHGMFWVWRPESPFLAGFGENPLECVHRIDADQMRIHDDTGTLARHRTPVDFWEGPASFGLVQNTDAVPLKFGPDDDACVVALADVKRSYCVRVDRHPARLATRPHGRRNGGDEGGDAFGPDCELPGRWAASRPRMARSADTGYLVDDRARLFAVDLGDAPELLWHVDLPMDVAPVEMPVAVDTSRVYAVGRHEGPVTRIVAVDPESGEVVERREVPGEPRGVAWLDTAVALVTDRPDGDTTLCVWSLGDADREDAGDALVDIALHDFQTLTASGSLLAVVETGMLHLVELPPPPPGPARPVRWTRTPLPEEGADGSDGTPHCGGALFYGTRLGLVLGSRVIAVEPRLAGSPRAPADFNLALHTSPGTHPPRLDQTASVYFAGSRMVMLDHPEHGRLKIEPDAPETYEKGEPVHIDALEVSETGRVTVTDWHRDTDDSAPGDDAPVGDVEMLESSRLPDPAESTDGSN